MNFNGLNTRDAEGAKSFYGSVFGWETLALGGGAGMWTLPGYGDYLERDNPGIRKQMAEVGAPEGFEDVVASINPIADDQPDVPAHWNVTFAVDDADATAGSSGGAGWQGDRPAVRCPLGQDDRDRRSAGRDLHREQVRPGEQGPRRLALRRASTRITDMRAP